MLWRFVCAAQAVGLLYEPLPLLLRETARVARRDGCGHEQRVEHARSLQPTAHCRCKPDRKTGFSRQRTCSAVWRTFSAAAENSALASFFTASRTVSASNASPSEEAPTWSVSPSVRPVRTVTQSVSFADSVAASAMRRCAPTAPRGNGLGLERCGRLWLGAGAPSKTIRLRALVSGARAAPPPSVATP